MYHCHFRIYLTGYPDRAYDLIREMPPLENFTHEFLESDEPEEEALAKADLIFVNLQDKKENEVLQVLLSRKREETEIILLVDRSHMESLTEYLPNIRDIWIQPMSDEEIKFRFLRWQQNCKMSKDYWETSQFLEAAINHTPNLVWYKDKNGIHEKVNDAFCKAVNKTKKQVEGQRHAYIWNVEQDDPACIESENEVMRKKETCVSEETIQTGEGTRVLTTYKSPLYDWDQSVMGTIGVAIDITQEREYEQTMLQKAQMLEIIFTSLDCGIIFHSIDGQTLFSVNRAALKILGYSSQEEMMDAGFDMIAESVVEEDKQMLRASIEKLEKEGDNVSVNYRIRHQDGQIIYVAGDVKIIKEHGKLYYQRFLLDCTAQKRQEEEREKRQMELTQALAIDYSLVCYYDLVTGMGKIIRNVEDKEILFGKGITLEESLRLYIDTYVYEEDKELMRQGTSYDTLITELSKKNMYNMNYRAIKGEEMKYFQMKVVRVGAWRSTKSIVVGFHSVDEEMRREMQKKNALEDALLQANQANKAKSVFLSNMSHDIRTPMNAIVGFTALAITHIENRDQVEEYLKKIMTSGNHLLSLINDVLDMSRIESGKMYLEEKPCSLPEILQGIRSILQAEIRAKQLELYIDTVDVHNEEIYCDKLRLNQVLLNLLSNAVKYTQAGGIVSLRITEKTEAPLGYAYYEFYIKDTGIGMSPEFVEHIFEPFERERNTTISKIQGTGLGMAITKNIVDMMNGTIKIKSEQNVGTEIWVTFTFRLNPDSKAPINIPELQNARALVVDDDFNTCDSVSYMLQQIGMRAEWTLSGKEAVLRTKQANMRNDNYCVYIIDWMLPDMNGIEVTRRIRKEMGKNVPIILLTAYDWTDIEEEAKEAGVTDFCSKPMFLSELRRCLYSLVSKEEEEEGEIVGESVDFPTGRILLAEDNELNQEIAVAILTEVGFTVDVAENGQIAVDMLKKSEPGYYQLVLTDIQMPIMNGYEAAQKIRNFDNKQLASIPIIAMTANAYEEDKQEALRCGMNGHIAKPVDIQVLFQTLHRILV